MADSKDSLKRQNYFDLKRDEFMAMDEYLLSPISEIDLRKMNEGGIATIEDLTKPIGMSFGGSVDELGTLIKKLELHNANRLIVKIGERSVNIKIVSARARDSY